MCRSTKAPFPNQTVDAYQANDTSKSKELAIEAYLDNFEHLKKPIGEERAEKGEGLMREQLIEQIDTKAPADKIKQTVYDINKVSDEVETKLKA